jgi:hypothetical protein
MESFLESPTLTLDGGGGALAVSPQQHGLADKTKLWLQPRFKSPV